MTTLLKNKINTIARVLTNDGSVTFEFNKSYYEIFESAEGGYAINVYSSADRDEDGELLDSNMIDGGYCSGSAKDAVIFMLRN